MLRVSGLKRMHLARTDRHLSDPFLVGTDQPHRAEIGAGAGSMPEAQLGSWQNITTFCCEFACTSTTRRRFRESSHHPHPERAQGRHEKPAGLRSTFGLRGSFLFVPSHRNNCPKIMHATFRVRGLQSSSPAPASWRLEARNCLSPAYRTVPYLVSGVVHPAGPSHHVMLSFWSSTFFQKAESIAGRPVRARTKLEDTH